MVDKVKYKLKGHEKFPLREGWLNKGIVCVHEHPGLFTGIEGSDRLGVGTNMVKSIRYWLQSFKLIGEIGSELTDFGRSILEQDVFFEDTFTLWVLHSNLVKNIEKSTVWYLYFNRCNVEEMNKEELFVHIQRELFKYIGNNKSPESSIKDDIDVMLNMYSRVNSKNDDPEDKNVSPFVTLGLIKKEDNNYIKVQPDLRKINEWVILYELSCMLEDVNSLSIDRIANGEKSLGSIYNLSRIAVNEYLDRLDAQGYIKVDRTAGLDIVYSQNMLAPLEVVAEYYRLHK